MKERKSQMLKLNAYSLKGTKLASVTLPKEMEVKPNLDLLAQAVRVYEERQHIGMRATKTRGDVSRTTKKWYKQKGTGGARHGARSAPIFVGGGIAHGPVPLRRELTLPQAMKQKALKVALSAGAKEGKVLVVSGLSEVKKTKEVQNLIDKVVGEKRNKLTFVLPNDKNGVFKVFKNIKNSKTVLFKNLNAYDVFRGGTVILDKDIFGKPKAKETK